MVNISLDRDIGISSVAKISIQKDKKRDQSTGDFGLF